MSYQIIDLAKWNRGEHFKFYQHASQPWFNITADVNATKLMATCKNNNISFFHAYLYLTQVAVNQHDAFKIRIVDDEVRIYQDIAISCAILANDETMRFCDIAYSTPFKQFDSVATETQEKVKNSPFIAAEFFGQVMAQNVIHMSVIPWVSFSSFSNARNTSCVDSIPKIIYGKAQKKAEGLMMPLSVEVHHGVMDGLQVGRFFETIQRLFNDPSQLDF
jgi:chloramphenicol O-acetyltransferase type A